VLEIVGFDAFSITATAGGVTPVALTDDTGVMIAQSANQRMGIYTISVDPVTTIVTLSLTVQTDPFDWVRVQRGISNTGAELYYPPVPESGDRRVTWQPLIPDVSAGTIFDGGSLQFVEPVDMYAPGDEYDKYLVWPKQNILGPLPEPENEHIVGWINDDNLPVKWINDDDLITYWTNI
jgi:hypothetical protein